MKIAIVGVFAIALASFAIAGEAFRVEKLSPSEVAQISRARAEFEAAQTKLIGVETAIRQAHGEPAPSSYVFATCEQSRTEVELKGRYALITEKHWNTCGTSFVWAAANPKE